MSLSQQITALKKSLSQAMALERYVVGRRLGRLKGALGKSKPPENMEQELARLQQRVRRSREKCAARLASLPRPALDLPLPIADKQEEIMAALQAHQVVIISGQTGSGKSTQIPKYCLALGRGVQGQIGCTQPRRIAALSIARRIAEELGQELGDAVGYKIRFQDRTPSTAHIKVMTDGTLLAEAQSDPLLLAYDTLIVDEAHERSLNIDLILGILKTLLKRRRDLKVVITSATLDTAKFSRAFKNAPVIEVSGRMYPVEVRYAPPESFTDTARGGEPSPVQMAVSEAIRLHRRSPRGDMLVFMPTEADIRETCELLQAAGLDRVEILPLYARLAGRAQSRVFSGSSRRKIIVATNVAETSLTIPGIRYVIDTGLARLAVYSPRTRTKALPVRAISRASADQRKGRCGRVAEGVCIRLYSEDDYLNRREFTPPEIVRSNLAEVILRMMALKLGAVEQFPFIDPPDPRQIRDGYRLLEELGAIQATVSKPKGKRRPKQGPAYRLTSVGRTMARIPLDPRLARILIQAQQEQCLATTLIITAVLSIQDPRERPPEETNRADQAHRQLQDPISDFATYLNIWTHYHRHQTEGKPPLSRNQRQKRARRFCREHYLSFRRMREWTDIHRQIKSVARECGLIPAKLPPTDMELGSPPAAGSREPYSPQYQALHRALLSGFLSNVAMRTEKNIYQGLGGKNLMLFPGSGLFNRGGNWIVAAEQVTTSRLFARTAANVDPGWIEAIGRPFLKQTYSNPRWDDHREQVIADQQVSLWGLVLASKRKKAFGPVDGAEASAIFIREALVNGRLKRPRPFLRHNLALWDALRDQEARLRRRDIVVSEEELVAFYQSRIDQIYDPRSLDRMIKQRGSDDFLRMTPEDLMAATPDPQELAQFPDAVTLGGREYGCTYQFAPGEGDDGVTITIPQALAATVPAADLEWGVPGQLGEKVTALIKGLPKAYRKHLVPVPRTVAALVPALVQFPKTGQSLRQALGELIHRQRGLNIPGSAWPQLELPDHLQPRVAIVNPQGQEVAAGRDPAILQQTPSPQAVNQQALRAAARPHERSGLTRWDFGDLEPTISVDLAGQGQWPLFPALVAPARGGHPQQGVALRLFDNAREARTCHPKGVAALLSIHFAKELKFLKQSLAIPLDMIPAVNYLGGADQQRAYLQQRVVQDLFARNIRTQEDFEIHCKTVGPEIIPAGQKLLAAALPVITAHAQAREELHRLAQVHMKQPLQSKLIQGLTHDLTRLVPANMVLLYVADPMAHLPRYINALVLRAQRGVLDLNKEQRKSQEVDRFESALAEFLAELADTTTPESITPAKAAAIEAFHWQLEEYKVSLFAQELKTAQPVSAKRLQEKMKAIQRMA